MSGYGDTIARAQAGLPSDDPGERASHALYFWVYLRRGLAERPTALASKEKILKGA